ncbi:MAG: hypothetical protein R2845_12325 [Thermomicrobiales bacterium]
MRSTNQPTSRIRLLRYHARSVAERLAQEHGALLILGSATPSIESVAKVNAGDYHVARLEQRVNPVRGSDRRCSNFRRSPSWISGTSYIKVTRHCSAGH